MFFDHHLTWESHINHVLQRVRRKLFVINRLRPVLCLLYQAFVLPIFDYCDTIWSPSKASRIRRLERVHSKFLSSLPSSHCSDLRTTLAERRTFHTAMQVFKVLHNISLHICEGCFHTLLILLATLDETHMDCMFPGYELTMARDL